MWENVVGRGRPFWAYWFPIARQVFREALGDVRPDDFYFAVNEVRPSLIRVQADEVTYNLHVLIRFELERAVLSGDLPVEDLPGAWNEKYSKYLGVTPRDDAEGCLQDIHWSAGLIGYFPTYTLGNVYAAQLYAKAVSDVGDFAPAFSRGDFSGLLGWLHEHVHRHGHRYPAADLVRRVTGSPPDHRPLVRSLREKYGELYGF
jgi:carboxypeptidase Taq